MIGILGSLDLNQAHLQELKPLRPNLKLVIVLTGTQHEHAVNDLISQGSQLVQVCGYGVGGQDFYAAIWDSGRRKNQPS